MSAWPSFHHRDFRALWSCALAVHIANWMQQVGAASLMAGITPNPMMTALVQVAASLPAVLLSLPAGALADMIDRRRWFLFTQGLIFLTALFCAGVAQLNWLTPTTLLGLTLLLGIGFALHAPASQAVVTEVVPRHELPAALALSSAAFNISRVLGPALAGALLVYGGGGLLYLVVAACSGGMLLFLWRWKGVKHESQAPPERLWSAVRTGLRYVWHAPQAQLPLWHVTLYTFSGSAVWALLPVVARDSHGRLGGYGLMLGALGVGGVLGVLCLPWLRQRLSAHLTASISAVCFAIVAALLAWPVDFWVAVALLVWGGGVWVAGVSTIYAVLQDALPNWVRARIISMHNLAYFAGMAGGALFWGALARPLGISNTLGLSSVVLLLAAFWHAKNPLSARVLAATRPGTTCAPEGDAGATAGPALPMMADREFEPLVVQSTYQVRPDAVDAFQVLAGEVGSACRRNGASFWRLYRDVHDPCTYIERYLVDSSSDLLRQQSRWTPDDLALRQRLSAFLQPGTAPRTHYHMVQDLSARAHVR